MGEDKDHPEIIKKDLINWKSNTLTNRLEKFSTLSVLYDLAKMLDQALEEQITDKDQRYNEIVGIWSLLLKQFTHFREAVYSPERVPELRAKYLCLKPTGQLIVIAVLALALRTRKELPLEEVIKRLNEVRWESDQPHWQNIAVVDGRINGTRATITLSSLLVAYLINLPLSDIEVQALETDYRKAKKDKNAIFQSRSSPKSMFNCEETLCRKNCHQHHQHEQCSRRLIIVTILTVISMIIAYEFKNPLYLVPSIPLGFIWSTLAKFLYKRPEDYHLDELKFKYLVDSLDRKKQIP